MAFDLSELLFEWSDLFFERMVDLFFGGNLWLEAPDTVKELLLVLLLPFLHQGKLAEESIYHEIWWLWTGFGLDFRSWLDGGVNIQFFRVLLTGMFDNWGVVERFGWGFG